MDIPGYTLKHRIGQGRFATLHLAQDNDGHVRAVKIITPALSEQSLFQNEFRKHIDSLLNVDHPNCMKVYDAGVINNQCYIVMDYYPDGSIAPRLIFGFPVKQILKITHDLINSLEYLNSYQIDHKNLQPRNVFLKTNNETVLSEFEVVRQILNDCPDIVFEQDNNDLKQLVDCQSDFNCLGLVFFKLLNRESTPFLEVPSNKLSGRRAMCWQPTIDKLFSNEHDETINDIYQLRFEINRVQKVFEQRIEEYKLPKQAVITRTEPINLKSLPSTEITNAVKEKQNKKKELVIFEKQEKLFNIENFLISKKIPIMTTIAASTAFILIMTVYVYFDNKYPSHQPQLINNIQRPDILFPIQNPLVQNNQKASMKAKAVQHAELKQQAEQKRLSALREQEEQQRLADLRQQEEQQRLAVLREQQKQQRLAALREKEERQRLATLREQKEQKEQQRLIALRKKEEQEKIRTLRQQRLEEARLLAEKQEFVLQEQKIQAEPKFDKNRKKDKSEFDSFATF